MTSRTLLKSPSAHAVNNSWCETGMLQFQPLRKEELLNFLNLFSLGKSNGEMCEGCKDAEVGIRFWLE